MEKKVTIDGLKIFYEETGDPSGNPVILLHGWGCNHSTVKSIALILESGMHVFNIDLPGHGKSQEPDTIWGTEDFARFIKKFIDIHNLKNPSIIGHSFGGRTSIRLAADFPFNKIVLVDSAGVKPRRSLKYYYKVYTYKASKKFIYLFAGKKKGEKIVERIRKKRGSADYANSSPKMRAIMSRCVNEDLKKFMPDIKSPVLLIWGDNDTATPLKDAEVMEKLIPDAGLVSFPGCGHYSFLDNPIGFKAVINEFFKQELATSK